MRPVRKQSRILSGKFQSKFREPDLSLFTNPSKLSRELLCSALNMRKPKGERYSLSGEDKSIRWNDEFKSREQG